MALSTSLSALALAAAAGCGGGGGAGDEGHAQTEAPAHADAANELPPAVADDGFGSAGPTAMDGPDSFRFVPNAALAEPGALDRVAGGPLFAAWNPSDPKTALAPGMKVMFFGNGRGCENAANGPLNSLPPQRMAALEALTGIASDGAKPELRWTPSGNTDGCDAQARERDGASSVYVNADDHRGAMALLTTSGRQDDGQEAFFGPFGTQGQNGLGTNAHITGSFVSFRQAWWVTDPLQPWIGDASARLRTVQAMGSAQVDAAPGTVAQAKQQMMASFLNPRCHAELAGAGKPCQIQYLFNTAIVRAGVTDWDGVAWFRHGSVWFDPAQGGIPIVDGPIKAAGQSTLDDSSFLPLFTSQANATQHGPFADRAFDVTVSFEQLQNVLRLTTARALGISPHAVNDAQLAAQWGSAWNDRNAWVLLSGYVGQEVYNPDSRRRVQIGGGFAELFVGPQRP